MKVPTYLERRQDVRGLVWSRYVQDANHTRIFLVRNKTSKDISTTLRVPYIDIRAKFIALVHRIIMGRSELKMEVAEQELASDGGEGMWNEQQGPEVFAREV